MFVRVYNEDFMSNKQIYKSAVHYVIMLNPPTPMSHVRISGVLAFVANAEQGLVAWVKNSKHLSDDLLYSSRQFLLFRKNM